MFRVYDCLSDIELAIKPTRKEANDICAIHGGADNCIHVFEIPEPVEKVEEIKEQKPLAGIEYNDWIYRETKT